MVALRSLFALAAASLLAGCATDGSSTLSQSRGGFKTDADYVYVVEKMARHKGVDVVWINPPREEGKNYLPKQHAN